MSDTRDYSDYLRDILDAAEKAERFVDDVDYASFEKNDEKAFAVIRALEIIGEAARKIPPELRTQFPDIHGARCRACATS